MTWSFQRSRYYVLAHFVDVYFCGFVGGGIRACAWISVHMFEFRGKLLPFVSLQIIVCYFFPWLSFVYFWALIVYIAILSQLNIFCVKLLFHGCTGFLLCFCFLFVFCVIGNFHMFFSRQFYIYFSYCLWTCCKN